MNLGNWTLTLWLLSTAVHCKRTAKGLWVHTRKLLQRNELTLRFSWTLPLLCLFWRYLWWFSHLTNNTTYSLLFTLLPLWVSLYRLWQKAKNFFVIPVISKQLKKKKKQTVFICEYTLGSLSEVSTYFHESSTDSTLFLAERCPGVSIFVLNYLNRWCWDTPTLIMIL